VYILKRIAFFIFVMIGVSLIAFSLINLAPGDPAEIVLSQGGGTPTPEAVEKLRKELGLDDPLIVQYGRWLSRAARFDFGNSFLTEKPVGDELLARFPRTLLLAISAVVFALFLSIPTGILAALYHRRFADHLGRLGALLGASIPNFWLGLFLIHLFAVKLKLLPSAGCDGFSHLILPAVTLGFGMAAIYARLLRVSLLEILSQEFIKVARAKGLTEKLVIGRHALKNALLPVITAFGVSFGHLLGGTVIVETIFAWPGIGQFAVDAIFSRDYPVIQGFVFFTAVIFVGLNLLIDISYCFFDPRVRLGGESR
jgi:peptide/nickel transport system permease protein